MISIFDANRPVPATAGDPAVGPRPRFAGTVATAIWLGLVVGLLEVGLLVAQKSLNHVALIGSLRLNQHYLWMIPLSHLVIFGLAGACLGLWARTENRLARYVVPRALAWLAAVALLLAFRELNPIASVILALGVASRVVPLGRRVAPQFARTVRLSLPFLVVGLACLIAGRHAQLAWAEHRATTRPVPKAGSPNVLFIVMDTVRAKNLSLYGYGRPTTPRLEALAREGARFDAARSAAPWTLPSHATMFTGRWPHELFASPEQRVPSGIPTLAGALAQQGYATGGFVANTFYCNAGFGLAQGFDHYEDFYQVFDASATEVLRHSGLGRNLIALAGEEESIRPGGRKDADKINADFLSWLPTAQGRPFFAFLNYFDAHAPYFTPDRADRHFGLRPTTPEDVEIIRGWQSRTTAKATDHELELARDGYDDCIAYLDGALGRLFDDLDRRGVLDNTLIVVTSDHGEEIGEHHLLGHGRSLYSEELHVPLVVVRPRRDRAPGGTGAVVAEPVSLRDLPATVLDLIGTGVKGSPFPGRSLGRFAALGGPESGAESSAEVAAAPDAGHVVLTEVALRDKVSKNADRPPALRGPMKSVVVDGHVYIRNSDGREELYDRAADPAEASDLVGRADRRPLLERLRTLADRAHPGLAR